MWLFFPCWFNADCVQLGPVSLPRGVPSPVAFLSPWPFPAHFYWRDKMAFSGTERQRRDRKAGQKGISSGRILDVLSRSTGPVSPMRSTYSTHAWWFKLDSEHPLALIGLSFQIYARTCSFVFFFVHKNIYHYHNWDRLLNTGSIGLPRLTSEIGVTFVFQTQLTKSDFLCCRTTLLKEDHDTRKNA